MIALACSVVPGGTTTPVVVVTGPTTVGTGATTVVAGATTVVAGATTVGVDGTTTVELAAGTTTVDATGARTTPVCESVVVWTRTCVAHAPECINTTAKPVASIVLPLIADLLVLTSESASMP
jgi:hypothetical protein